MKCRIGLHQVASFALHGDIFGEAANLHRDFQSEGDSRAHFYVLGIADKALGGNAEVVVVRRYVGETEVTVGIGRCRAFELAHRVLDVHSRARHHRTCRIANDAFNASRVAAPFGKDRPTKEKSKRKDCRRA